MIPVICPSCGCERLRMHGSIYEANHRPRWILFGPLDIHRRILGHDWSCRECFYQFTTERGRTVPAPAQALHEAIGVNRETERPDRDKKVRVPEMDSDVSRDPRDPPRKR